MKNILLVLFIMFTVIFSFGLAFMEYKMYNPTMNLIMIVIGIPGAFVTGYKLCKK